jgi:hypothetical protein
VSLHFIFFSLDGFGTERQVSYLGDLGTVIQ